MTTATRSKLLWVAGRTPPANVRQAARGQWELCPHDACEPLSAALREAGVAVVHVSGALADPVCLAGVLSELERSSAVAIFLIAPEAEAAAQMLLRRRGQFLAVGHDIPAEELEARLETAAALQPAIERLQRELQAKRKLQSQASAKEKELNEELRLASRLQRDFLPRRLPEVGPVRFAALYRPAGWVGGDIYDVARLDETHVGFYVADAVGHGLPAALLTMFIKKAFQTKRIVGNTYQIVPPEAALEELNTDISEQQLSGCPFCTAVYGIIDTASLVLTFARAGHPEPVLIRPDGSCRSLPSRGTLLGVFPEETFESRQVQLAAGDRLVFYSDGIEPVLKDRSNDDGRGGLFADWFGRSRQEILFQLNEWLDSPDSKAPDDDVTVLIMDIED